MKNVLLSAALVAFAASANAEVWCDATPPSPYDSASGLLPTQGNFDGTSCEVLEAKLKTPSATQPAGGMSAAEVYENLVSQFFINMCHRRLAPIEDGAPSGEGWYRDKFVRQLGPDMATGVTFGSEGSGKWQTAQSAFHQPAVIWYNQTAFDWISVERPGDTGHYDAPATPMPDGAIIVKEMYDAPATVCQDRDPITLFPTSGIAFMVRDAGATHDGWYWGYYGLALGPTKTEAQQNFASQTTKYDPGATTENTSANDWPPQYWGAPAMGFGQYCLNCHASAVDNSTFSTMNNLQLGEGEPESYLTNSWFDVQVFSDPAALTPSIAGETSGRTDVTNGHELRALQPALEAAQVRDPSPGKGPIAEYLYDKTPVPTDPDTISMISATYDTAPVFAGPATDASEYLTSDQCAGCHDAGGTGMQFDMTHPLTVAEHKRLQENAGAGASVPHLYNYSPYATWRTSPMGLAGRDPIFYAQLASETNTFHSGTYDGGQKSLPSFIENTCLGCHGIAGQRQFQIDTFDAQTQTCENFTRADVDTVPSTFDDIDARHAALARDGINCTACHRMNFADATVAGPPPQPTDASNETETRNICVAQRQAIFSQNGEGQPANTNFAATFTGSFKVGAADEINGPFGAENDPAGPIKTVPMENALGLRPQYHEGFKDSAACGSCHTVHLPVLGETDPASENLNILTYVYEQTTYPEWAFSDFRSGELLGVNLLGESDQGSKWQECQECHLPSKTADGTPYVSKIAGIQERTNFSAADYTESSENIDLPYRQGFAKHTLVGLNMFLVEMADQFPNVLGIPASSPMLVSNGLNPADLTKLAMLDNARNATATVTVGTSQSAPVNPSSGNAYGNAFDVTVTNLTGHKFPSGVGFRRAFIEFTAYGENDSILWQSGGVNPAGQITGPQKTPVTGEVWWTKQCTRPANWADRPHQPHYELITAQDQAQIYQELVSTPPAGATSADCGHDATPAGELTTSFLSICSEVKDNRLYPSGFLPLAHRVRIAKALGAQPNLAEDTTAVGVTNSEGVIDPDYDAEGATPVTGADTVTYAFDLPDVTVARVTARLLYQATPPFYLQDRFCTGADSKDTNRLLFLADNLVSEKTPEIADWVLQVGATADYSPPR
ncbi:hypothetical protein [Roseovarius aestuariivivens]|uniref:hypothetical protein n=1 Tax=Roseovarius aestuariivivens TaxID=1888910 RepID=UPI0010813A43|nr:hypothetical protein [Roseovarius aestuariivivens]